MNLGRKRATPPLPSGEALTEAFLWSTHRTVTKTATVSLHSNTYQVEPALVGRKVELVFSPSTWKPLKCATKTKRTGPPSPT